MRDPFVLPPQEGTGLLYKIADTNVTAEEMVGSGTTARVGMYADHDVFYAHLLDVLRAKGLEGSRLRNEALMAANVLRRIDALVTPSSRCQLFHLRGERNPADCLTKGFGTLPLRYICLFTPSEFHTGIYDAEFDARFKLTGGYRSPALPKLPV